MFWFRTGTYQVESYCVIYDSSCSGASSGKSRVPSTSDRDRSNAEPEAGVYQSPIKTPEKCGIHRGREDLEDI